MRKQLIALALALIVPVAFSYANSLTLTNRSDLASGTATSVSYVVSITGTNLSADVVTNLVVYFGSSDGHSVASAWGLATKLDDTTLMLDLDGGAEGLTNVLGLKLTNTIYGTLPDKTYWFNVSCESISGTVWATSSGTYVTPGSSSVSGANPLAIVPSGASVTNTAVVPASYTNILKAAATQATLTQSKTGWVFLCVTAANTTSQVTLAVVTNVTINTVWGMATTGDVATNAVVGGTWAATISSIYAQISNLVTQVGIINSNQHKMGMP